MSRAYYAIRCRLDGKICFLIWHTASEAGGEADGVCADQAGALRVFRSLPSLINYAQAQDLAPLETRDTPFYDLDIVNVWLKRKRPGRIDCPVFLSVWNLLGDVSASVGGGFDPNADRTQEIYRKLFWGSNLPALTPPGKHFPPRWSGAEALIMRQVLGAGLSLFRDRARVPSEPGGVDAATPLLFLA